MTAAAHVCLSHFQGISKIFESPRVRRAARGLFEQLTGGGESACEAVGGSWWDCLRWSKTRKCSNICDFGSYLTVYGLKTQ